MNLIYGEIVELFSDDGLPWARVRVGPALKRISLALVEDTVPGDTVLVCDGSAIAKVETRKEPHVSGHSR